MIKAKIESKFREVKIFQKQKRMTFKKNFISSTLPENDYN